MNNYFSKKILACQNPYQWIFFFKVDASCHPVVLNMMNIVPLIKR